jgi:hypothetical protein
LHGLFFLIVAGVWLGSSMNPAHFMRPGAIAQGAGRLRGRILRVLLGTTYKLDT